MTAPQRTALIDAFMSLRGVNPEGPQHVNHWRIRADRNAAIFEARFDQAHLTVANVTQFLANAVGVNPALITSEVASTARGPLAVFSAGGTPRLRMIAFGGLTASWADSRAQAAAYLTANLAEWGA